MSKKLDFINVVGAGLAGSEAAWQIAKRGIKVKLYEMRPKVETGAHLTSDFGELVCSNSLGSNLEDRASGVLKNECRTLDSFLIECAEKTKVPAGQALAVDREGFAKLITQEIEKNPLIEIIREEVITIPEGITIIASGPLTSSKLSRSITELTGSEHLYFYDAISPIISLDSINMNIAFRCSRYDEEDQVGDYINCPFNKEEYYHFVDELLNAETHPLKEFEQDISQGVKAGMDKFFEGCLPVEIIAKRGKDSLAYGPMRPVGLTDPRTGRWPFAAIQLRQDNLAGDLYNIVGFQTNLRFQEQDRVFRLIPGLENAEIVRHGQMHRNTFIHSPTQLKPTLQFNKRSDLFFAGQITGVEGYMGNIATGLLAGINAVRLFHEQDLLSLPPETILGALCHYVTKAEEKSFQPMKANFGILPKFISTKKIPKKERMKMYAERALESLKDYLGRMAHN